MQKKMDNSKESEAICDFIGIATNKMVVDSLVDMISTWQFPYRGTPV